MIHDIFYGSWQAKIVKKQKETVPPNNSIMKLTSVIIYFYDMPMWLSCKKLSWLLKLTTVQFWWIFNSYLWILGWLEHHCSLGQHLSLSHDWISKLRPSSIPTVWHCHTLPRVATSDGQTMANGVTEGWPWPRFVAIVARITPRYIGIVLTEHVLYPEMEKRLFEGNKCMSNEAILGYENEPRKHSQILQNLNGIYVCLLLHNLFSQIHLPQNFHNDNYQ